MVSTRRQSHGLQDGDSLAVRAKEQLEPKVLRDGTLHGDATPSDRPTKKRRTRSSNGEGTDDEENLDTIIVTPAKGPIRTASASKRNRGKNLKSNYKDAQEALQDIRQEPKHQRFGSEEPEPETSDNSNFEGQIEKQENRAKHPVLSNKDEDDSDEAPEQVNTTSSTLIRGLPSLQSTQGKSKTKRRRVDSPSSDPTTQEQVAPGTVGTHASSTTASEALHPPTAPTPPDISTQSLPTQDPDPLSSAQKIPSGPDPNRSSAISQPPTTRFPTSPTTKPPNPTQFPSTTTTPHLFKSKQPSKPQNDIRIPSRNLTIRHYSSQSDPTDPSRQRIPGSLPLKASKSSREIRNTLLRGRKGKGTGAVKSKGFLVR